jgi:hypothetical protein
MTYDQKSYDLAEYFIKASVEPGEEILKKDIEDLAKTIQYAIEEWLEDWEGMAS